jgi:hypothetical protein
MTRFAIALCILVLAGCSSFEERATRTCERMGYDPGTDSFENCMNRAVAEDNANRAAGAAMLGAGTQLLAPPPRPVICNSNPMASGTMPSPLVCY